MVDALSPAEDATTVVVPDPEQLAILAERRDLPLPRAPHAHGGPVHVVDDAGVRYVSRRLEPC